MERSTDHNRRICAAEKDAGRVYHLVSIHLPQADETVTPDVHLHTTAHTLRRVGPLSVALQRHR